MPKPNEEVVSNLTKFTEVIERRSGESRTNHPDSSFQGNWYRGIGRAKHFKLLPHLYRHPNKTKLPDLVQLERGMLDDFKRQSVLHDFGRRPNDATTRFELLFYMQHYGVPTRLLDWTSNPFIALFFALTDPARREKDDVAVWVLDPVSWNGKALEELAWKERGPAYSDDEEIKSYHPKVRYTETELNELKRTMYPFPVAIFGVSNNARMFAQRGVFTCFGSETVPMEATYEDKSFPENSLFKIVVRKDDASAMLRTLTSIGYTDSVSYPDLHGLALEIKRLRGFRT